MNQSRNIGVEELKTITYMTGMFTSFAKFGHPRNQITRRVNWPPITNLMNGYKCLNVSNEVSIINFPQAERMAFWDSLYDQNNLI